MRTRPDPVLQTPGSEDCLYCTVSFIARVLGFGIPVEEIRRMKAEGGPDGIRRSPEHYFAEYWGVKDLHWCYENTDQIDKSWWMGSSKKNWVLSWLKEGYVGIAHVHRGSPGHAVAVLEGDENHVTLMDPLYGIRKDSWSWFLGPGPGQPGAHAIYAWYPL